MASILIVDDSPNIVYMVERILANEGHNVAKASSGREALAMVDSKNFDLVLMDIMMPGMNGWETIDEMYSRGKMIPVIILTVRTDASEKLSGLSVEGVKDYITKPFDVKDFITRVNKAIGA